MHKFLKKFIIILFLTYTVQVIAYAYVVKKADTLSHIAQRDLGDAKYWHKLYHRNTHISNPHLIYPGQKLTIKKVPAFSHHWLLGVTTGALFLMPKGYHANVKFTFPSPRNVGTFNVDGSTQGAELGLLGGYALNFTGHWFSGYRLTGKFTQTLKSPSVEGKWEYKLHSPSNFYTYAYNVDIRTLGLDLTSDIYRWKQYAVYLGIGAGEDWLTTSDFRSAPVGNKVAVSYRFVGAQRRNWYYEGTIGVRYNNQSYSLGLAYVYKNLGKVNTGQGETAVGAISPGVEDTLTMNNVQLSLMYNF